MRALRLAVALSVVHGAITVSLLPGAGAGSGAGAGAGAAAVQRPAFVGVAPGQWHSSALGHACRGTRRQSSVAPKDTCQHALRSPLRFFAVLRGPGSSLTLRHSASAWDKVSLLPCRSGLDLLQSRSRVQRRATLHGSLVSARVDQPPDSDDDVKGFRSSKPAATWTVRRVGEVREIPASRGSFRNSPGGGRGGHHNNVRGRRRGSGTFHRGNQARGRGSGAGRAQHAGRPMREQVLLNQRIVASDQVDGVLSEVASAREEGIPLNSVNLATALHRVARCGNTNVFRRLPEDPLYTYLLEQVNLHPTP